MADTLAPEIAAFERLKPELLRKHGAAWTVIAGGRLEGAFETFDQAAHHALERLGEQPYLIRHTLETPPAVPFLIVEA